MLKVKRLIYILLIVVAISMGLMILNNLIFKVDERDINTFSNKVKISGDFVPSDKDKYLILYNEGSGIDKRVYENILKALSYMKVSNVKSSNGDIDITIYDTVIIANRELAGLVDPVILSQYIINGGKVLFAGGLPEKGGTSYLNPIWGVIEKGERYYTEGFKSITGFFIDESIDIKEGVPQNSSTVVRLSSNAEVFVKAKDGNPIVWTNNYKSGRIAVVNGSILEDFRALGVFTSTLCALEEVFVYPVLGIGATFLDLFPPNSSVNKTQISRLYGRNVDGFSRDILWPDLLKVALKHDLKYTASFMAFNEGQNKIEYEKAFAYICKEILKYNGEVALGGSNLSNQVNLDSNASQIQQDIKKVFKNYSIRTVTPIYGQVNNKDLLTLRQYFENLSVIRGAFSSDQVQAFDVIDDVVYFPYVTQGFREDGSTEFTHKSILSALGVISHSFNFEDVFIPKSSENNWNLLNQEFTKVSKMLYQDYGFIEKVNASTGAEYIENYHDLKVERNFGDNSLQILCQNLVPGQKFFLRSDKIIKGSKNCKVEKISSRFYLLTAKEPVIEIEW